MPQAIPTYSWLQRIIFMLVAGSLLVSIVLDVILRSNSGLLMMMDVYAVSEGDLVRAADGRNVALQFENFRIEDGGFAQNYYFLGNYAIWPHRMYASENPVLINTGFDLLDQHFSPDDDWLRRHDCAGIINYFSNTMGLNSMMPHTKFRPTGSGDWIQIR